MSDINWKKLARVTAEAYTCPYCGNQVASEKGFYSDGPERIYICPLCTEPTYFSGEKQIPGTPFGDFVDDLPEEVEALYEEARQSMSTSSYTAASMLCRKVLMNVAVAEGAGTNKSFAHYVDFLAKEGYVPPKGRGWVDHIRTIGNEANHEIEPVERQDAEEIVLFTGMLLRFMYELPAKRSDSRSGK